MRIVLGAAQVLMAIVLGMFALGANVSPAADGIFGAMSVCCLLTCVALFEEP